MICFGVNSISVSVKIKSSKYLLCEIIIYLFNGGMTYNNVVVFGWVLSLESPWC
jgi:hypothetical protein